MPDAAGPPPVAVKIPDGQARRVTLTGHDPAGRQVVNDALLIVHNDTVYVVSVDAARPTAAIDAAIASITWAR